MSYTGVQHPRTRAQHPRAGHAPRTGHQRPSLEGPTDRHQRWQPRVNPGVEQRPMRRERVVRENPALEPSTSAERSLQRRQEGYYMHTPNSSQNQKLKTKDSAQSAEDNISSIRSLFGQEVAWEETEAHEQHRASEKQRFAEESRQYPPQALGGAAVCVEEVRKRQAREQNLNTKFSSIRNKQKREEYIRAKKQREEEELEKKKKVQREKGKRLEQKRELQKVEEREEVRRKRLELLDRQNSGQGD